MLQVDDWLLFLLPRLLLSLIFPVAVATAAVLLLLSMMLLLVGCPGDEDDNEATTSTEIGFCPLQCIVTYSSNFVEHLDDWYRVQRIDSISSGDTRP